MFRTKGQEETAKFLLGKDPHQSRMDGTYKGEVNRFKQLQAQRLIAAKNAAVPKPKAPDVTSAVEFPSLPRKKNPDLKDSVLADAKNPDPVIVKSISDDLAVPVVVTVEPQVQPQLQDTKDVITKPVMSREEFMASLKPEIDITAGFSIYYEALFPDSDLYGPLSLPEIVDAPQNQDNTLEGLEFAESQPVGDSNQQQPPAAEDAKSVNLDDKSEARDDQTEVSSASSASEDGELESTHSEHNNHVIPARGFFSLWDLPSGSRLEKQLLPGLQDGDAYKRRAGIIN